MHTRIYPVIDQMSIYVLCTLIDKSPQSVDYEHFQQAVTTISNLNYTISQLCMHMHIPCTMYTTFILQYSDFNMVNHYPILCNAYTLHSAHHRAGKIQLLH